MREKRGSKTKTNNVVALVWFRSSLIGRGKKRGGDERSGLKMTGPDVCLVFDGSLYVRKINRIYIYIDRTVDYRNTGLNYTRNRAWTRIQKHFT